MAELTLQELATILADIQTRLDSLSQIPPNYMRLNSLSELTSSAGVLTSGEFRSGNSKEPGRGFSGVRLGYPGFSYGGQIWHFVGINADVLQVGISSVDGQIYAGGGNVQIGSDGILIGNAGEGNGFLKFRGTGSDNVNIGVNLSNFYFTQNDIIGGGIFTHVHLSEDTYPYFKFYADPDDAKRVLFHIAGGSQGARLDVARTWIVGSAGGAATEYDYMHFQASTLTPPNPYGGQSEMHVYLRNNKFIIQFNQGGTLHYKYLDLTGTGVTWVHSASGP